MDMYNDLDNDKDLNDNKEFSGASTSSKDLFNNLVPGIILVLVSPSTVSLIV